MNKPIHTFDLNRMVPVGIQQRSERLNADCVHPYPDLNHKNFELSRLSGYYLNELTSNRRIRLELLPQTDDDYEGTYETD